MLFSLYFADLTLNDIVINILVFAVSCVVAVCCVKAAQRGYGRVVKLLVILLVLATLVANWLGRYPGIDETEHLHATWLISQGLLPFRDFFQHHSPLFWLLLAPLVKLVPHTGVICDFARITSMLISTGAWCLAALLLRRVHRRPVRGIYYVLALLGACACGIGQFNAFRPDLLANVMSMGALLVLMSPRLRWRMFLSGALFGLAFALTPKHYFFFGVLPLFYARDIVILLRQRLAPLATRRCWEEMARQPLADWFAPALRACRGVTLASLRDMLTSPAPLPALGMHYLGAACGCVPLLLWLYAHQLVPQFMFWCLQFNQMQAPMIVGGEFPLLYPLIFGVWLLRARMYHWTTRSQETRILAIATLLGALIFFTYTKSDYNAQMFFILASVAGAPVICDFFARCVARKCAWICGGLVGISLMSYPLLLSWLQSHDYLDGRSEIAMLNRVCQQGPVVGVTPRHPLFMRDASDLDHPAQWDSFMDDYQAVRDRLMHIDEQIYSKRPTVIFCGEDLVLTAKPYPLSPTGRYSFVQHLWYAGVLNTARAAQLQAYIDQHYQLILFVRHYYWVRNDLVTPDLPPPYHALPAQPAWELPAHYP